MVDFIAVMLQKAREAWAHAYAPYSGFIVGACIKTSQGQLFACANVENASYPLSICAEAGAIVKMVSSGENKISEIVVLSQSGTLCPPCGACRQQIREFANRDTLIHLCTAQGVEKTLTIDELLPYSFSRETL